MMWMLRDAFVEAFSRLWNKLGFSWIAALVAAVNPIFVWMVFEILWIMTGHAPKTSEEGAFLVVAWIVVSLTVHVFPTSFAAMDYMRGVYEMDVVYIRRFFVDFWKAFRVSWWRSFQLLAVFGVLGIMIGYAFVFYGSVLTHPAVRIVFLSVIFWVYVVLSLAQFVLLPLLLYNPKIRLWDAFQYSLRFALIELLMVAAMAILDVVVFFLLSMGYGFALLTYYLFGINFRLGMYKQIQKKYLTPSEQFSESEALSSAWKDLLRSKRKKDSDD